VSQRRITSHVVRRAPAGGNRKPHRPDGERVRRMMMLAGLALLTLIACGAAWAIGRPAATEWLASAQAVALSPAAPALGATATPEPPEPTSTFLAPSPTPTRNLTPLPTRFYQSQPGDTLPVIAARFGVNPEDIRAPAALAGETTLNPGQLLVVPMGLGEVSPGDKLVPDAEVVFSPSAADFDGDAFANEWGGYLANYKGFVESETLRGGDVLTGIGQQHSINPRTLAVLLEQQSGWVTDPAPAKRTQMLGFRHPYRTELGPQLNWAANQLAIGYYGWRAGTLTSLTFPDGSTLRLNPALNPGTVAVQYFFSQLHNRPQWDEALTGFAATYRTFFGDPFARPFTDADLLPGNLQQPPLALPFARGLTWYLSGGPHGAWENGGAQAALDFAPAALEGGCAESDQWVTAAAAGKIVRSTGAAVALDLDGDGREATGWVLFYYHIAEDERVAEGKLLEAGDKIGHPSCEGGRATGTHVHLARKFNGEWMLAAGAVPFNLEGWVARSGAGEYQGALERDGVVVKACDCTAGWTAITAGR
jgi:murein DD-endopeptidase MepM/ murein hydrolase activator NlpD